MEGKLYLMCGVPASGKSYFAKSHMSEDDIYMSRDEVRFEVLEEGDAYFSKEKYVFETWTKKIAWALKAGFDVWADATHLNAQSRAKTINALRRYGCELPDMYAIVLDTPQDTCMRRNSVRDQKTRVPDSAMYDMRNSFRKPELFEGFNMIFTINPNGNTIERR